MTAPAAGGVRPQDRDTPGDFRGALGARAYARGMAPKEEPRSDAVGFEAHLEALEEAVRALESAELTLEDSLSRYQDGVAHLRACRGLLDEAEARLAELVADADGELEERPLRVTEQGLEDDPER